MFSYIIGGLAIFLVFANPISQYFFPESHFKRQNDFRPQLNESLLAINGPNDTIPECSSNSYTAYILKSQPLVVYLENFLSQNERDHLLEISEPIFEPSTITNSGQDMERDVSVRDSSVAFLPRTNTVRCIENRALAFQGWRRDTWIERLRTQKYIPGGHYGLHYDWSRNLHGWGRVSSMMAWVDAGEDLVGGGTEFPMLDLRSEAMGEEICKFVECEKKRDKVESGDVSVEEEDSVKGTIFKVKPGNAVYWENFAADGRGYEETYHAGLPVKKGHKVGLNIWSYGRIE